MSINGDTLSDVELCLFVLVDGARADAMKGMVAAGELPNMARHLGDGGSSLTAVTCLPSSTSLAYVPMLAGQYPGTANVPGNRWIEKESFGKRGFLHHGHRSYVGPGMARFTSDLSEDVETIFELCPDSLGFRSEVQRGLAPSRNRYWHLCGLPYAIGHYIRKTGPMDRWVLRRMCKDLRAVNQDGPRFMFLPLSDVDTRSHGYGPNDRQVVRAYRGVDEGIGAIVETLQKKGLWSKTLLLVSSDHGNTATATHLDLSRLVEEAGYKVFEYPMVHRRNCTAAVMVSGNALANVYVASGGKWEAPLTGQRLRGEHGKLLKQLKSRDEIEFIAYREDGDQVAVDTAEGRGLIKLENAAYEYRWDGLDPLQLGLTHTNVPQDQALAQTVDSGFPDALEQLWHLFRSGRTGDIVVTAKPGYDLRARYEWPRHRSSHGALCRDQMFVPLLSNRPLDGDGPVRTVDIFATITQSLGLEPGKPQYGRSLL